jgi:hypothetical protein
MVPVDYQRIQPSTRRSIRGWLWRCRGSLAVVLLAALSVVGCATAHNYLDPAGPRYEGRYAPPPATVERARTEPLRVITFNIEYGREVDRAVGLLGENATLRDAEILLLQEMDPAGVERIAHGLGLNYVYFPSGVHPFSGRDMGTAILSVWQLEDARKIVLPHAAFGTRLRRVVTTATIVRGTDRVRVYSVHLPAPGAISYALSISLRSPVANPRDWNRRAVHLRPRPSV